MSLKEKMTALADVVREKAELTDPLTIDEMTSAISELNTTGMETADATAGSADIRQGKTAYIKGEKVTGTIPDLEAKTYMPGTEKIRIYPGVYVNGTQEIQGDTDLIPQNIRATAGIFGVGGTFTIDADVTAADIRQGKTAYAIGQKVKGTMPDSTVETSGNVVTVEKGYVKEKKELTVGSAKELAPFTPGTQEHVIAEGTYLKGDFIIKGDENLIAANIRTGQVIFDVEGTFTGDADALAEDIRAGKTVYVKGEKITGAMAAATPFLTDNTVTVPAGYVSQEQQITVGSGKTALVYTPGTADIIIPQGSFLLEDHTVKGDSNLISENIRAGQTIFDVEGTFTSDADAAAADILSGKTAYVNGEKITGIKDAYFYRCVSVDENSKTWTGCRAFYSEGIYSFDTTPVEGLYYGENFVPEVDSIYDNGCTLIVNRLYMAGEIDFGADENFTVYGRCPIPASFTTSGRSNDAYRPYRSSTEDGSFVFTGPTENLTSWSRVVVNDAAYGIKPVEAVVEVHNYTDLNEHLTVTAMTVEGSCDMETWDELGRQEGVNPTGVWSILCTPQQSFYKALRIVFTSAVEGSGAVLSKVTYSGIYSRHSLPTASPYNPPGFEYNGYTITSSYSWWDEERPWKAFNFGVNAAMWGSDTTDNGVGQWIAWECNIAKCIKRYQLRNSSDNRGQGFALQGYDEKTSRWVTIDERVADSSEGVLLFDCSENTGLYRKHRLICTSMESGAHFQLNYIAAWE